MRKLIILLALLILPSICYAGGISYYNRFDATTISGCQLWLDADDSDTITLNGSNVSQWNDKSGNGYNAVQGLGADQPAYNTSGMNNKATIDFDSSNTESLIFATDNMFDLPMTAFVVTEIATQQDQVFISRQESFHNGGVMIRELDLGEGRVVNLEVLSTTGSDAVFAEPNVDTPFIISCYCDSSNGSYSYIARDGGSFNQASTSISGFTNSVSYDARIGRRADGSQAYLDGKIAEIIFYNRILTSDEIDQVQNYLSKKWGVGI